MYNFRTDLALERRNIVRKTNNLEEIDGIETEEKNIDENLKITRVKITNENGEQAIGKKIGTYVTIDIKSLKIAEEDEIQKSAEILAQELKEIINKHIKSKDDVLDYHMEKVRKAYPAYFDTYDEIDKVIDYINTIDNLFCVGRNGQHRYNNLDHSMVTSFEAVKDILEGVTDKSNVWNVNTEKEYHEEKKQ